MRCGGRTKSALETAREGYEKYEGEKEQVSIRAGGCILHRQGNSFFDAAEEIRHTETFFM